MAICWRLTAVAAGRLHTKSAQGAEISNVNSDLKRGEDAAMTNLISQISNGTPRSEILDLKSQISRKVRILNWTYRFQISDLKFWTSNKRNLLFEM